MFVGLSPLLAYAFAHDQPCASAAPNWAGK
jgi:hypothetical protein